LKKVKSHQIATYKATRRYISLLTEPAHSLGHSPSS